MDSDPSPDTLPFTVPSSYFFAGQLQHLLLLVVLIPGAWALAGDSLGRNSWLGIQDRTWFSIGLVVPMTHQFLGWLVFRSQLCFKLLTRLFGQADLLVWGTVFMPLLIARPIALVGLTAADSGSLGLPGLLVAVIGILLLVPPVYTLWSVVKYFGIWRALGGDHFRESYRRMPLVQKGVFRWNANAMYSYMFLALWAIALIGNSRAALAVAMFQHAYIWVHMFCTESPDMQVLYKVI